MVKASKLSDSLTDESEFHESSSIVQLVGSLYVVLEPENPERDTHIHEVRIPMLILILLSIVCKPS